MRNQMGLKEDAWIRKMAMEHAMIEPFCENQVGKGVVSYGLSSYGYDIRVSNEFKNITNINAMVVDLKILMLQMLSILSVMFALFRLIPLHLLEQ